MDWTVCVTKSISNIIVMKKLKYLYHSYILMFVMVLHMYWSILGISLFILLAVLTIFYVAENAFNFNPEEKTCQTVLKGKEEILAPNLQKQWIWWWRCLCQSRVLQGPYGEPSKENKKRDSQDTSVHMQNHDKH